MCEKLLCLAVRQDVKQSEEVAADSPRCRHNGGQEEEVARVVVIRIGCKFLLDCLIQSTINRLVGWLAIVAEVRLRHHVPVELMAQGSIDHNVPDASKLKIFDPEVGLFVSTAVGHTLAVGPISCLLEALLNGREDVLVSIVRGACVLLTAVQMISQTVNYEVATWACIVPVFP